MSSENKENSTICTQQFDVNGVTINRVIKQSLLSKFFPVGNNIACNPRPRFLLSLWVEHTFGEKIAFFTTKYEKQARQLQSLRIRLSQAIKKIMRR